VSILDSMAEILFVLVETKYSGNLGMAARAIKNFGFHRLILINPLCEVDDESICRSMHARDVLENVKIYPNIDAFIKSERPTCIIGTTARVGSEKNPLRIAVPIQFLRDIIIPADSRIAFIFGNEERGLRNEELMKCDFVVTIPTSMEYPTLNLSHAVSIVAYEISQSLKTFKELPYRPATALEKKVLINAFYRLVEIVLKEMPEAKKEIYKGIIKNLVGRAFLSGREAHSLIGLIKRTVNLLLSQN